MRFDEPLIKTTLVKRYKRFLADVQLENGDIVLREADDETAERLEGVEPEQQVIGAEAVAAEGLEQKDSLTAHHGSTARVREPLVRISFSPFVTVKWAPR